MSNALGEPNIKIRLFQSKDKEKGTTKKNSNQLKISNEITNENEKLLSRMKEDYLNLITDNNEFNKYFQNKNKGRRKKDERKVQSNKNIFSNLSKENQNLFQVDYYDTEMPSNNNKNKYHLENNEIIEKNNQDSEDLNDIQKNNLNSLNEEKSNQIENENLYQNEELKFQNNNRSKSIQYKTIDNIINKPISDFKGRNNKYKKINNQNNSVKYNKILVNKNVLNNSNNNKSVFQDNKFNQSVSSNNSSCNHYTNRSITYKVKKNINNNNNGKNYSNIYNSFLSNNSNTNKIYDLKHSNKSENKGNSEVTVSSSNNVTNFVHKNINSNKDKETNTLKNNKKIEKIKKISNSEYDYTKLLDDLKNIFGGNLEFFDVDVLYNNLDENSNKKLVKGLIMLANQHNKKIEELENKIKTVQENHINELKVKNHTIDMLNLQINKMNGILKECINENQKISELYN